MAQWLTARKGTEEWRPVVGYEGRYEVSNMGRIRSLNRITLRGHKIPGKDHKTVINNAGYTAVKLTDGKRRGQRQFAVHKLVLWAFVGPRPAGMETCHNNGDRRDPRLENLRWDTHKANLEDARTHKTIFVGEQKSLSKLTEEGVRRIREASLFGALQADLAAIYGVCFQTISRVVNRESWAHVP